MGTDEQVAGARGRRIALQKSRLERFKRMLEIRRLEDRVLELYSEGHIAGSTHTCQGQEAVSVGIAVATPITDVLMCTYRGHGLALAAGATPVAVLGEILNRQVGTTGGLGGSMHLMDLDVGLFPTYAIVGAGIPIAAGAALAAQIQGTGAVAVSVFGDGTVNIGAFHEGLNLASIWELPCVFVCENNLYGEYTRFDRTTPIEDLAERADSYGMHGVVIDGQDVDIVETAMRSALERARAGEGPTLLEVKTYRFTGHSRGDPATYRPQGELESWLQRDPIDLYRDRLVTDGMLDDGAIEKLEQEVSSEVEAAVELALASPLPTVDSMFEHILAPGADGS
jgi:pyruvate dehydrogenase E1 component alpha subunit